MKSFIRRHLSFVAVLSLIFVAKGTFADQNFVPSGSMEPTIHTGDFIIVNKLAYDVHLPFARARLAALHDPRRGDIVVFINPVNDVRMVKRLIGVPGDRIDIENGFARINGQPLAGDAEAAQLLPRATSPLVYREQVGAHAATIQRTPYLFRPDHYHFTVPAGEYFAMGDNRDNSWDSRGWGFIPRDHIEGRAVAVTISANLTPFPKFDWPRTGTVLD